MGHRHLLSLSLGMALFTLPFSVLADPVLECSGASSQVETGACVGEAATRVDLAVDLAYGFAMDAAKELDDVTGRSDATEALEAGQSAWAAYREAHCDFVGATFGGGSGTGIAITACRAELGRARIAELTRYFQ